MTVADVFEEDVLGLICGYAQQSGRSLEKNSLFMMSRNVSGIYTGGSIMCFGDINGHIGRHTNGLDWVHEGMVLVRVIWKEECY